MSHTTRQETTQEQYYLGDFMDSPFDLGPHRYPRMLIKIAYQLTDTTPLSGNTILVPGSNNYTRRLQIPEGQNDPDGALELELRAGDAFLFESRTFHRIGLNRTDRTRKCLMMGYSYGWISPLDYDVQPDWLLGKVTDPIVRQLVGGNKLPSTIIDPWALREWAEKYGVERASDIEYERLMAINMSLFPLPRPVVELVGEVAVGAPVELDQLVEVGADHARVAVLTELRIAPLPGDVCGRFTEEWQVGVPGAPARGGQIDAVAAGGVGQRHEQVAVVDRVTKALGSVRPARRQVRQVGEAAVVVAPDLSLRLSSMERVGVGEADEEVERPGALAQEAHGAVGQVVGLTAV